MKIKLLLTLSFLTFFQWNALSQCAFGGAKSGVTQGICYNTEYNNSAFGAVQFTNVAVGNYVAVKVISGLRYNIIVSGNVGFIKRVTLFNASSTASSLGSAIASNNNTDATVSSWLATFTGELLVRYNDNADCAKATGTTGTITVQYAGGINTIDDQNLAGTDSWVGHVYDFSNSTVVVPPTDANAFGNYLGNFTQANSISGATRSFVQGYGGNDVCFPFTAGGTAQTVHTDTFAIRYRMNTTASSYPAGCYFVNVRGDDGVRLYIDGQLVFNAWAQQSPTSYNSVLVYLSGTSTLVFDFYEKNGQNESNFSITPVDVTSINSSNTITPTGTSTRCVNTSTLLIGSTIASHGGNSTIAPVTYQWQSSTDNSTWTNITGATAKDFTVPGTNPAVATQIYYRRNVQGSTVNSAGCVYSSNAVSIITDSTVALTVPIATAGTNISCSSFTANWNTVNSATSYLLDVSTSPTFSSFVGVYNGLNVGFVTSYNVTGLSVGTYYYRVRANSSCPVSTSGNSNMQTVITVNPLATISGTTTVCQNAASPNITFTNPRATGITVTYTINGGANQAINVGANTTATLAVPTATTGTFTYSLVSVVYQTAPTCSTSISGSAPITVNPNVTPTFTAIAPICSGATLASLPTTSNNGITGTWSPALDNTATTTYTFTPTAGLCATTANMTVTVNPNVTPTFTAIAPICSGATLAALPTTSNNGITGTWSPALDNTATTTYTFTPTAGLCATSTTLTITVNPNVIPTFTAIAPICSGATLAALPTTSNNGITGTWSPALDNTATTTYTFTPTAGLCATTANLTVTVNPNVTPTFTAISPICSGATLAALPTTSNNGITGTWSPALDNTATTTYTFTPTVGLCATTTTLTITVNPNVIPTFTAIAPICSGATLAALPTTSNNGITGTWSPSLDNTTTTTYTFTPTAGLCATTANLTITVNPLPTTPTVGTITNVSCTALGSVVLSGLQNGWTITQSGTAPGSYTSLGTSYTVTGLAAGNYTFTANNGSCNSLSTAGVPIIDASSVEWNGTGWVGGIAPDATKNIIISSVTPNSPFTANLVGCSLTINSGVIATVASGVTLTITNAVTTNGQLIFENNASLVQTTNVTNTGTIEYRRISKPMKNFDFTYWSSPVANQNIVALSPNTLSDKYFRYDPLNGGWIVYNNPTTSSMIPGRGYIIRVPKPGATYPNGENWNTPTYAQPVAFKGVPNNGDYSVVVGADQYNLIGNPYPSALDADLFMTANSGIIYGALYFWTHKTAITNNVYTANDYATYTLTGGVGTGIGTSPSGIAAPTRYIGAGQSFFVGNAAAGSFQFTNAMRVAGNNTQFFKQASTKKTTAIEKNRVWLNLTNSGGAFKQLLVGYITGATNDWDNLYDGPTFDGQTFVDFYSINQGKNLTIQGRALPFETTDEVPLGYRSTIAGDFDISIDTRDGQLATQEIWLEDKKTNTTHELSKGKYTFTAIKGVENNRFVLKYTNKTLGNTENELADKALIVSVKNKKIILTSSAEAIAKVQVFDLLGRKIYDKANINAQEWTIANVTSGEQVLLVKTTLTNGAISSKKIIL